MYPNVALSTTVALGLLRYEWLIAYGLSMGLITAFIIPAREAMMADVIGPAPAVRGHRARSRLAKCRRVERIARPDELHVLPQFASDRMSDNTPAAVTDKLNTTINESLQTPEAQAALLKLSAVTRPGSPRDFSAFMSEQAPIWAELVRMSGASIQ